MTSKSYYHMLMSFCFTSAHWFWPAQINMWMNELHRVFFKFTVTCCPRLNHLSAARMWRSSSVMPLVTLTLFGCFIDEEGSIKGKCISLLAFSLLMFHITDTSGDSSVSTSIRNSFNKTQINCSAATSNRDYLQQNNSTIVLVSVKSYRQVEFTHWTKFCPHESLFCINVGLMQTSEW